MSSESASSPLTAAARRRLPLILSLVLLHLGISATLHAQSPGLTQFKVTPTSGPPGSRVTVQLIFNRVGQAMPILTSSNPRVFHPGGGWNTNGSSMVTRRVRLGTTAGCSNVRASWGGARLDRRICVEAPTPPPPPALCDSFTLRNPGNNASFTTRSVALSWNTCSNATRYRVMMRPNSTATPTAVWQGNATGATVNVATNLGDRPIWFVEASRGNARRNSSQARFLRFAPPPPPPNPRLTWDSLITATNLPSLTSWPTNLRQRVEGQHSIKSIVESRVVVRGDGQLCSACHFNNGPRLYRPNVGQNGVGPNILRDTNIPRSFQQQGSWRNLYASEFTGNDGNSNPIAGRKPSYLRQLIDKWVQDGRRR